MEKEKDEQRPIKFPQLTDEQRFLVIAEQVLNRHLEAFKKLANEGDEE